MSSVHGQPEPPRLPILPASPLAAFYDRHLALIDGVAWGWTGTGDPVPMRTGVTQVGVGRDAFYALRADGTLIAWTASPADPTDLASGVRRFAAGHDGWFMIDGRSVLHQAVSTGDVEPPVTGPSRIAAAVASACVGDGADYYVTDAGVLFAKGRADRGQYGDGRLTPTATFVPTARDVVAVDAHTGHAIHLRRDGTVMGTGGNRFGPLSTHGLGDKADAWGTIFEGAVRIATGARHSAAIRADGGLWIWGEGFSITPAMHLDGVTAVAAGDTATLATTADGRLWQWEGGAGPVRKR